MTSVLGHPFLLQLLQNVEGATADHPWPDEGAWRRIISDAADQGIGTLLYKWLHESGSLRKLPTDLRDRVKMQAVGQTAHNLALAGELRAILQALQQQTIPCIPIRGVALSEQLYGDPTVRLASDIDLLVRRESLGQVAETLRTLGYRHIDVRRGFAQRYGYTLELQKQGDVSIIVEPHWTIAYPPFTDRVDMAQVWGRSRPGTVVGIETPLLDWADLLFHLCCHLMHWRERAPLLWYVDLDCVIRQNGSGFDWDRFVRTARESGQNLLMTQALRALTHLLESPVPEHVFSDLAFPVHAAGSVGRALEQRIVALLAGGSDLSGREEFAQFMTIKGLRARLRYALSLLFPSPAFMQFRHGPATRLELAYQYCIRPFRLGWEGLRWVGDFLFLTSQRS